MAKSEIEKVYAKQLKRIKQFIRRAEQRGYQFTQNLIPKKPKKISQKSVERLKKITPEKAYKKSVYGGEATQGEIVKGTIGRRAERKLRAQKSAQTRKARREQQEIPASTFSVPDNVNGDTSFFERLVINEYRRQIAHFGNKVYLELDSWLNDLISQYGEHAVAEMLEEGARNGTVIGEVIAHSNDDSKLQEYMSDMFDYLEFGADYRAGISDAFDEDSNFDTYR